MSSLAELAREFGISERTLRRGVANGLVRAVGGNGRVVQVSSRELAYLRGAWPLLAALRGALRNVRELRFAVLFGDAAVQPVAGDAPLEMLLSLHEPTARPRIVERLERASGREVSAIDVHRALADAREFMRIVHQGRLIAGKREDWVLLRRRRQSVAKAARIPTIWPPPQPPPGAASS